METHGREVLARDRARVTPLPRLTLRKVSILLHLEAGRSYKQIAADLEIHEATVRAHIMAIADTLPGTLPPKERVLLHCQQLLAAHADVRGTIASDSIARDS
jgi:DNA-binding CsgD family transcriptional regulator